MTKKRFKSLLPTSVLTVPGSKGQVLTFSTPQCPPAIKIFNRKMQSRFVTQELKANSSRTCECQDN